MCICEKCGCVHDGKFGSGRFCSRKCANSKNHSQDTKNKIRKSIIKLRSNYLELTCNHCQKTFVVPYRKREQKFCSRSCAATWRNIDKGIGRIGGLASAKKQSKKRRSKNEILFFELCRGEFNQVKHNEPLFNGWDADVIIEDCKIAVLWNGKWHYEKLAKNHSVKQVQSRDKIKIKEIKNCGYKPYIVKDLGRANVQFVEGEFKKFLDFCNNL